MTGEVVFVGYGVSAPELGYDDYADTDVTGKIILYLSGSPAMLPSTQRAYYSSGAVKNEEASARGAVGMMSFTYPEDPRFRWYRRSLPWFRSIRRWYRRLPRSLLRNVRFHQACPSRRTS